MNIKVVGIDLAKNIFQMHEVDEKGRIILQKQVSHPKLAEIMANLPPCLVGMEACGGEHYWARKFLSFGHTVKSMNPQYVKPYVKTNKNDAADSEAICEVVTRPNMRFVPIKSQEQQDIQTLHRIRSRLIQNRTALANQVRGLLQEYGIVIPQGLSHLRKRLPDIITSPDKILTPVGRGLFSDLYEQ